MNKDKVQILLELNDVFKRLADIIAVFPQENFQKSIDNKWSAEENLVHLITSNTQTKLPFVLPKFLVALIGGKANRVSVDYEKVVANYQSKLNAGAKASGIYVPKKCDMSKEQLLKKWIASGQKLIAAIAKTDEKDLDRYVIPHPLLGKITLRELCYFTIYHTSHHLQTVSSL